MNSIGKNPLSNVTLAVTKTNPEKVAIVRLEGTIQDTVNRVFELSDPPPFKDGDTVAIKLNLCFFRPYETGATTDPRILEAVINYLRSRADRLDIILVESDATSARVDLLFQWLGFNQLAKRLQVRTLNLSNDERVKVELPSTCHLKALWMPKTLLDADHIISLAKLKTHGLTKITCSLKNHYGSIPYRGKIKWHPVISQVIADANVAIKTSFSLVDGIIAMEGLDGPIRGTPRIMNILVAGRNPVAVDSACARIMGFDPGSIRHIVEAERRGLGSREYQIVGEDPAKIQEKFEYSRLYHTVEVVMRSLRKR